MDDLPSRRPLKSRSTGWARVTARLALRSGLTPNAISVIGVGFAAMGAAVFVLLPPSSWWWLLAAFAIQLRLLANMLDGMVAVEGGRGSPTGPLFNEAPDRIEDSLLLIGAGYGCGVPELGWIAALLAVSTAYVRALGASFGMAQDFSGPMAKPHRMAVLTLAAVSSPALPHWPVMAWALGLIALGTALTCVRRLVRVARGLKDAGK